MAKLKLLFLSNGTNGASLDSQVAKLRLSGFNLKIVELAQFFSNKILDTSFAIFLFVSAELKYHQVPNSKNATTLFLKFYIGLTSEFRVA